jgi:hypothetical protein
MLIEEGERKPISDDYYIQRATDIVNDKHSLSLLEMICNQNGIDKKKMKDFSKRDLRELVFNYLKKPLERMILTSSKGMKKLKNKKDK